MAIVAAAFVIPEAAVLAARRGSLLGLDAVVRCGAGHLYTTIWVPGASVKSLRLGWWRLQWCPVGRHWALVTPARTSELSDADLLLASQHHDARIP